MKATLYIPVTPAPWQAPRLSQHGVYSVNASKKKQIRCIIAEQWEGKPYDKYVALSFLFCFKIPKTASKKQRAAMLARKILPTKGDCTNCQKLFEDCLNKLVITDDRNVGVVSSAKMYADEPSVTITVQDYTEYFIEHMKQLGIYEEKDPEAG